MSISAAVQGQKSAASEANEGVSLAHAGRYKEAIRAYQRAIVLDPKLPGIYLNLGLAYFKSGDFRHAVASFEKQKAIEPSERLDTLIAMSRFGLGEYREAANLIEPLAAAHPDKTELAYLLAKCYLWSKQTDRAMQVFRTLLTRDPNSAAVHMLMGEALDADRRTPEAVAEFQAAVKVNPAQPDAHFGLAYLYWELHDYENAEREFQAELRNNAANARAWAYLGDTQLKLGNEQPAATSLAKAIALDGSLHIAHVDLAAIAEKKRNYPVAVQHLRDAIRTDPEAFDAHYRLARLYKLMGDSAEAQEELAIVKRLHEEKAATPLMDVRGPTQ